MIEFKKFVTIRVMTYNYTMTLYTIGHSNRSLEDFLEILDLYEIDALIDIRTIPKSRYVPWFNRESLAKQLAKQHIHYQHLPSLGGLRHPHINSQNNGWKNASFRGFADYMQTKNFFDGLKELNSISKKYSRVVIMCAEAVPWRCHRSLIADAELIRRVRVLHILSKTQLKKHKLTSFACIDKTKKPIQIIYRNCLEN